MIEQISDEEMRTQFTYFKKMFLSNDPQVTMNCTGAMLHLISKYLRQKISDIETTPILLLLEELSHSKQVGNVWSGKWCAKTKFAAGERLLEPEVNAIPWSMDHFLGDLVEEFWTKPLAIAEEHNLVMDGHHRLEASLRLKLIRVPCFVYSYKRTKEKNTVVIILLSCNKNIGIRAYNL